MTTRDDVKKLAVEDLCELLSRRYREEIGEVTLEAIRSNRVSGQSLLELTEKELAELVPLLGDRKVVKRFIDSYALHPADAVPQVSRRGVKRTIDEGDTVQIPDTFSRSTMHAMEQKVVTKSARTEIVTAIAFQLHAYSPYPTSQEYTSVCESLVQKYPVLKDTIGNGYGSWKQQLRQKLKNMRRSPGNETADRDNQPPQVTCPPAKKKDTCHQRAGISADDLATKEDGEDYAVNMELLSAECGKENPSRKAVRKLCKKTFHGRRLWILKDSPAVQDVLETFPALRKEKFLKWELSQLVEGVTDGTNEWQGFRTKLKKLAVTEATKGGSRLAEILKVQASQVEAASDDESAVEVLQDSHAFELLAHFLAPRSKQKLLQRCSMHMDLDDEVAAIPQNFPYLVFVCENTQVQLYIVVERLVLHECTSFLNGVMSLISVYFTFNIEYPKALYAPLIFIQHFILNIRDKQRVPPAVVRLISSLDNQ